jgi:hypothetical protein
MWLLQYACHDVILYDRNEGLRISKGKIFTKAMVSHFFSITEHAGQMEACMDGHGSHTYTWSAICSVDHRDYRLRFCRNMQYFFCVISQAKVFDFANMGQLNSTDVSAWTSWQDILLWVMLYG